MKSNKLFYKNLPAFTLVELIVVIVILAILATISFLSFDSYSSKSRDSVRLSDTTNITKGLELFQIKAGNYPIPNSPTYYTGGLNGTNIITQGTINGNIIGLSNSTPSDPLTNTPYTYSIFGSGYNYQIYSELENSISYIKDNNSSIIYADNGSNNKVALIKGNYFPDPSLPSLIVIPSSIPTTSGSGGIFSPDVCFITNSNTTNILSTSNSSNCTKKRLANLNTTDSSLVGYWDMETTTGGLLRDLSGNGNNGIFSGGMAYSTSLTGGVAGKGLNFDGINNYIQINNNINLANSSISVGFWIYSKVLVNSIYLSQGSYSANNELVTFCATDGRGLVFAFYANDYQSTYSCSNLMNRWIHIFNTYDANTKTKKIYVNGVLIGSRTGGANYVGSGTIFLGQDLNGGAKFTGVLEDIKIYNRALSDTEIKQQAKIVGF